MAGVFSGWAKAVATSGKTVATYAFLRTAASEPTPGAGQFVAQAQEVKALGASVLTSAKVTMTGGQRAGDGFATTLLATNPKRAGFRVRVKSGPAYFGGDDQVDATTGEYAQTTESFTIEDYTGPVFMADDGTHAVEVSVLEWSYP